MRDPIVICKRQILVSILLYFVTRRLRTSTVLAMVLRHGRRLARLRIFLLCACLQVAICTPINAPHASLAFANSLSLPSSPTIPSHTPILLFNETSLHNDGPSPNANRITTAIDIDLWPDIPWSIIIPNLYPTSTLAFLEYDRPGTTLDNTILLQLIRLQLAAYHGQTSTYPAPRIPSKTRAEQQFEENSTDSNHLYPSGGLPNGFTLRQAGVKFSMQLTVPKPGEQWMSMPLAIMALQLFNSMVESWGALETYFVALNGTVSKGQFRVEFFDLGTT